MTTWKAFCEAAHAVALALWLGFLVAAGTFAALVFRVMRELDPKLPAYAAYSGEHSLIVGGKMAQTVFFVTDVVQFACSLLAIVTLIALFRLRAEESRRPVMLIRASSLVVAVACVASLLIVVSPKIVASTGAYWSAARAGDMAAVEVHRAAAGQAHPYASALMAAAALMVTISLIAAVWSTASPYAPKATASSAKLPEPALLRGSRR